ncbi:MAG: hypothetical protein ACOX45_01865 [Acutalibacteraceae bacterium]
MKKLWPLITDGGIMSCYVRALKNCAEYQNLIGCLKTKRTPLGVLGLPPVAKAHIIFSLCLDFGCKALVLMPDEASALKACEDVNVFSGGSKKAVFYPVKDFCYTTLQRQSKEFEHLRIAALHQIIRGDYDFIFCAAQAALQFTIPPEEMISRTLTFKTNSSIQYDECVRLLTGAGYTRSDMVEGPGQFSLRGGILDIFPTNEANPVRIELWGDEIDTISEFDVSTQRRTERKESISIAPSSEVLFNSDKDLAAKLRSFCDTLKGKRFYKGTREYIKRCRFC